VPRHRQPGRAYLDCAQVAAGWRLTGELQAPRGKGVPLEAGRSAAANILRGNVAASGGQGGPGQRDHRHPLVGAPALAGGDQPVQPAGGGLEVGHQGHGGLGRVAKPVPRSSAASAHSSVSTRC
jgi:hypothetical protein